MENAVLLRGGTVYTGTGLIKADVLMGDGVIKAVEPWIEAPWAQVFPAEGLIISPGFVDLHVHLREPGFFYKETVKTGTLAAAAGGFTTVCAMPNVNPVPDCPEALEKQLDIIRREALVEVIPYGAITKGEKGLELADIGEMAPYCAGFSDDGKGVQASDMMERAMERVARAGSLIAAHCEEESLIPKGGCVHDGLAAGRYGLPGIPSKSEWLPIQRDLELVEKTGARYHVCHVSAKESVELIRKARKKGLPVTCECTPHQIMLCDEDIGEDDGRFKMNPPLRGREDRAAILEGLLDGTIGIIATDHAPHSREEKSRGLAGSVFGVIGLETALGVCYTALVKPGRMTLEELLNKLTKNPAALLHREAVLKPGVRADVTVLDTEKVWRVEPEEFRSMGRATPFAGMELTGKVMATFYGGKRVF